MFEDIRKNKIKTGIIVSLFVLVITLIVYYICMAFDLGPISLVIALAFSIISAWSSYYYSDKIVLTLNRARPATEEENRKLVNIFDALMISSGLSHRPKLYIIEDAQPNAFATGRNPEHSVICVTTALLEKLDYYELEGVLAHEMSHIRNYDILLSAVVTVMVGLIVMLADLLSRTFLWGRSSNSKDNNGGGVIMMLVGLVLLIVSPIFAKLMQLAISRRREFLADATAVEITRNPDGLINALRKLDNDPNELETANTSTENMFIVNPFRDTDKNGKRKRKKNWFSTHPSIEDRIEALENLR
ncbi:MAG: M48 family metallopeptidase [Clostridia bacterium]